ncbi:MAG: non-ribosomal peptide synthetase, partial [Bacteroidota bacterium]
MNKYLLHRFIEKYSAENAQRIAIAQGGVEVSYQELNELVNQLTHLLQQKGIQKGDPVGILLSSSIEYLGCLFAVMKIGAIAMPLDANYPENKLKNILADVHPRLLFSTEKNTDLLTAICGERQKDVVLLSYTEEGLALQEDGQAIDVNSLGTENVTVDLDGTESCYLLFTSGSTSKPKGIEGVFKSLSHFIHWEAGMLALDEGVRVSQLAPISFDVSLRDVFLPILLGGRICIPGEQLKFQINEFIRWIQTSEIDVIHCVPSYFRLLIKAVKEDARLLTCLSSVKNILVAGEPLYGRDVNSWFDLMGDRVQLVNLYGPSETTLAKLFYKVPFQEYPPDAIIPLGKPISNASALIVSEGQMCVPGQKAEILLKTPFRTKGYYKNEELNKVKFVQNPLHNDFEDIVFCTGDIGSFDADGNVHFHGRTDDMVKYNGNRIELAEVQNVALKSEEIELAVAQIRMSSDEDQLLVLYYKSKSGLDQTNVLTQLYNANLPLYMHPALFVALDEVPRLPNGKVNKHALNDIPLPSHSAGEEITDELELEIAEIWKNLLNVSSLSRGQSFFQLGGTSLKAIQLISKIYKKKKVLLNLKSIFDQPTVGGIRQLIEAGAAPKDEAAGEKKKSSETSSGLSFTQEQLAHWIGSEQESADFNMPYVYTIAGPLDGPL